MKYFIRAAALTAGIAATSPAFAERWVEPVNGTVSAIMMTDGGVMMKLQLPEAEFQAIDKNMRAHHNNCEIKEIVQDEKNSVVLICGAIK